MVKPNSIQSNSKLMEPNSLKKSLVHLHERVKANSFYFKFNFIDLYIHELLFPGLKLP